VLANLADARLAGTDDRGTRCHEIQNTQVSPRIAR
jgi:hypothetical protein